MKRGARRPVDKRMISLGGTGVAVLTVIYACNAKSRIKQCFRIRPRCFWCKAQEPTDILLSLLNDLGKLNSF